MLRNTVPLTAFSKVPCSIPACPEISGALSLPRAARSTFRAPCTIRSSWLKKAASVDSSAVPRRVASKAPARGRENSMGSKLKRAGEAIRPLQVQAFPGRQSGLRNKAFAGVFRAGRALEQGDGLIRAAAEADLGNVQAGGDPGFRGRPGDADPGRSAAGNIQHRGPAQQVEGNPLHLRRQIDSCLLPVARSRDASRTKGKAYAGQGEAPGAEGSRSRAG